jgi:Chaperone of endosialidase
MNPLFQCKPTILPLLIAGVLAFFGLLPKALAVVPPPDGGYPNFNTAEGQNALFSLTTGAGNTAVGWSSLFSATGGSFNTAVGAGALVLNSGDQNTATGAVALFSNTTGIANTANGAFALFSNATGSRDTATGNSALQSNTTGSRNTATGVGALFSNTTGDFNTAYGDSALNNNTTGEFNTALGNGAGINVIGSSGVICIGHPGEDEPNTTWIEHIYGRTTVSATTLPVVVSNGDQLGTTPSAARFKKEIKPMDKASESVIALKPVTFQYKSDKTNTPQFGLVADEVAKVNPDLVVRDKNGEIYTVRNDAVNAMLLNEFLKEHRKVEQQRKDFEAAIARQQKQIDALTTGLRKVSAQIEASKPAPKVVNNP